MNKLVFIDDISFSKNDLLNLYNLVFDNVNLFMVKSWNINNKVLKLNYMFKIQLN